MKVYGIPEEVPEFVVDYTKFDWQAIEDAQEKHKADLVSWLKSNGYIGENTGRIYSTPKGDGFANYMFADAGPKSALIHLPYGDSWHEPDVEYLPKHEILKRISQQEKRVSIFSRKEAV